MAELLTKAEIEAVTGRSQTAAQSRYLQQNNIRFSINAKNEIVLTWFDYHHRGSVNDSEPDFGALARA